MSSPRRSQGSSSGIRNVRVTRLSNGTANAGTVAPYARTKALVSINPKMRSGSQTKTKRKPKETSGQNSEYVAKKVSYGRKPKNDFANLSRFVRGNISRTVFGIHQVSRFGGLSGAVGLAQIQATPGVQVVTPVHMYDLTGCVNTRNGAINTPYTSWYLAFSNETSTATASLVSNVYRFAVESAPNATSIVQNYPGPSSIMRWAQAKMMFYAPTTVPSKISVQIVQFIDQDLEPDTRTNTPQVMTTRGTAWYQAYLKKLMFSPIETTQAGGFKGIKVLHSETFIINPKESTEPTSTHYKQLELFKWFNRKCSYDWDQTVQTSDLTATPAAELDQNQNTVHPKARIFLIIKGQSGYVANSLANDSTKQPSYDIVLRTAHEQLNS